MSVAARLNGRITQLAVGRHLPHRAVRVRLTLLYGGLFLLSGAALMAIAYALLVNAGFVFSLQNSTVVESGHGRQVALEGSGPRLGMLALDSRTHPSAQTMLHWREVAQCMRRNGVPGFPEPLSSVPSHFGGIAELSDRDGAIFAIPATINTQSRAFTQATATCGYMPDYTKATAEANDRRTQTRQQLLIQSAIALAGMSLLSLGLGWLMAGRVLQPLEDSYNAQRQFVANAAHELRAPLTRLRALSEVALASPEANAASLRTAHERVLVSEEQLEQLIDAMLALTRGQAGLERQERLDLQALASHAMLARGAQLADLDLDVRATLEPARASGDPRLIEPLIANLIDNAIRHNTPGGRLEITTGTRNRSAYLAVTNTGPTIPPDQIGRLFQPFQRMAAARTEHINGHGLGLSIVQAIASAHHAELTARARPEGGLAVEISFPPPVSARRRLRFFAARTKRSSRNVSENDVPAGG
jgi:signal transduction histidine kinase